LLTEEEKRTLIQEGHQVPSQLPLTKGEEKILKKIRRKIKNKISAQESRRKKKEYVDSLEKRMDTYINENSELKRRLDELARNNKSLLSQLQSLKATLESSSSQSAISTDSLTTTTTTTTTLVSGTTSTNPNQFATLLMVLVLFFAVVLGVWSPVFTKDHLIQSFSRTPTTATTTTSTAAATITTAATKIVQNRLSHRGCGVGGGPSVAATTNSLSSSAAATVTAVCAAASAVAAVTVKTEPESVKDASPLARSKTGSQIELTKVRPFLSKVTNKLPIQQQQQQQATNDSANVEESGQVIFLNIANSDSSPTGSPVTLKPNFNILSSKMSQKCDNSKLGGNYRVINTNTGAAAAAAMSPCGGGGKLPTIFRVINNNPAYLQQSIIKFTQ
jgi:cyclic AMP-responsive element-binding protein 3